MLLYREYDENVYLQANGNLIKMVLREDILKYSKENYNTEPERLWKSYPKYEVLRHKTNRKWYAIIMDLPKNKIGLESDEIIDVLDIKCEPEMISLLVDREGFMPAYHMNKEHWISIILDGSVSDDEIYNLIDISYELTK